MTLVFIILAVTIVLLLVGKFPMEIVAFGGMLALFAFGVLGVDQILAGFSNATVVTIAALFVVGGGLFRTGVAEWLARHYDAVFETHDPLRTRRYALWIRKPV